MSGSIEEALAAIDRAMTKAGRSAGNGEGMTPAESRADDEAFFLAHETRRYRAREWRRSDVPGLHPREEPYHRPSATVVERGRFGVFVRAMPTFFGAEPPKLPDTDAGAVALIAAGERAERESLQR